MHQFFFSHTQIALGKVQVVPAFLRKLMYEKHKSPGTFRSIKKQKFRLEINEQVGRTEKEAVVDFIINDLGTIIHSNALPLTYDETGEWKLWDSGFERRFRADRDYLWPIPQAEIEINDAITKPKLLSTVGRLRRQPGHRIALQMTIFYTYSSGKTNLFVLKQLFLFST